MTVGMQKTEQDGRAALRAGFIEMAGWGAARLSSIAGDASTRAYVRLIEQSRTAVLMDAPPRAEGTAAPVDADDETRRALGYNAMARLAGPNLHAFLDIAQTLRDAGLSAPAIYAADPVSGLALIEDLGDGLYARAIAAGAPEAPLYAAAIDALLALQAAAPEPPASAHYTMQSYDRLAMAAEVDLLPHWYWRFRTGKVPTDDLITEYQAHWRGALVRLPVPSVMVLRDFHAENLLWLPDREGVRRVGVIDFQDGLIGHAAYDLVSLLEDARRDVEPALAAAMIERFCDGKARADAAFDRAAFAEEFAIIAAQRNAKILGIFARLILRDGKERYRAFLPRVEAHFRGDLQAPALAPLKAFLAPHFPDLAA